MRVVFTSFRLQGLILDLFDMSPPRCQTDDEETGGDKAVRQERVSPSTRKHTIERTHVHTSPSSAEHYA